MRSIIPASVSQSRLDRPAVRRQRTDSSRTSGLFDRQLSTAMARTAGPVSTRSATPATRQTLAASELARQNSVTSPAARQQEDPARASSTSSQSETPAASNPFFGPLVAAAAKESAAAAAKKQSAAQEAASATAAAAVTEPKPLAQAAIETLHEALRKANIEPSGLNLYYEEIPVFYPGGSYVNRFVTLELSPARKESYDVNLMMKNPWLTAFEIGRFMSHAS